MGDYTALSPAFYILLVQSTQKACPTSVVSGDAGEVGETGETWRKTVEALSSNLI